MLIATSWDDGLESDCRLIDILEKYGVRSSFAITPLRHTSVCVLNDARDVKYGFLMPKSGLHVYQGHEVCNHTAHHCEVGTVPPAEYRREIREGKEALETIFCRPIPGIVWPYGVTSAAAITLALRAGHTYGRLTWNPATSYSELWSLGDGNDVLSTRVGYRNRGGTRGGIRKYISIVPRHWRTELSELLDSGLSEVALSGHTYEFTSESDWDWIDRFYRTAAEDDRCQLVTLSELAERRKHVREREV
jgi:hypothetical protein